MLNKIFGINWRTTILGIGVIVAAVGRTILAFKNKNFDFLALADDGQLIMTTLAALLTGVGLLIAKDASVIGAGTTAKSVDSAGTVSDVKGNVIGQQPAAPPEIPR